MRLTRLNEEYYVECRTRPVPGDAALWVLYRRLPSVLRRSGMYIPLLGPVSAPLVARHLRERGHELALMAFERYAATADGSGEAAASERLRP
jgi:hypothetical protein